MRKTTIVSVGSSFWKKKKNRHYFGKKKRKKEIAKPRIHPVQGHIVSQNAIGHIYQLSPKKEAIELNVVHLLMTDEATYR